ncbi:MAG: class I SAM-dependent methyltransferase [Dissulfurispiraceae bacterium]
MRCLKCGFEFVEVTTNANLQSSFEDFDEAFVQYLENNAADEKNFQALFKWIESHVDITDARVLDVGCGSGKFVRYLQSKAVDARGIEPSSTLFDRYLSGGDSFEHRTVESLSLEEGMPWKVITILDVLEHVEDPRNFIMAVGKILDGDGCIFITTPDAGSGIARFFGRHWHFYHKYHLSYFSKKTFSSFCEAHGFDIKSWRRMKIYFSVGYIIRYAFRLISSRSVASVAEKFDSFCIPLVTGDRFGVCLTKKAVEDSTSLEQRKTR